MGDLLSIGRFGRLCGLSVGALRHYDELGLLAPARVDEVTGYRFYRREQADVARTIARLRDLDVPLPEIAGIVTADAADRPRLLAAARRRAQARLARTQRQLHHLNRIIDHEEPIVTTATPTTPTADEHRQLGVDLFNHVWTLLEMPDREPMQDDEMIHAAHASRHHWAAAGTHAEPYRLVTGEWQCSRVYATLRRAEPALWHARRALALCDEHDVTGFFRGASHEALARALQVAGNDEGARAEVERARAISATLDDPEDREILDGDLATIDAHRS